MNKTETEALQTRLDETIKEMQSVQGQISFLQQQLGNLQNRQQQLLGQHNMLQELLGQDNPPGKPAGNGKTKKDE